ncbi:hypothetical protein GCM10017786_19360 [Amycolatopsis deserti]|uniref:Uncharacterized protein n=1 Tax=Amycolatopsis deserti TaxID=185696 RepID=A0ABQ3IPS0_9PSEU|nr:hypothetical protein GCM10017786_19360 [Amycolatopsis deserti]
MVVPIMLPIAALRGVVRGGDSAVVVTSRHGKDFRAAAGDLSDAGTGIPIP